MTKSPVIARLRQFEAKLDMHLFGLYKDPATGKYMTPDGKDAGATDYAKAGLKTAGIGAGLVGAAAAHSSIVSNYGGAASGSVGNAYREAGRNAIAAVKTNAAGAASRLGMAGRQAGAAIGSAAAGAADRAAKGYTAAREIGGLGAVAAAARGAKKAANPLLAKLRRFNAAESVRELAAKI